MPTEFWKLAEDAADWQCDWERSKRFQLRYFRNLTMLEKFRSVEEMCRLTRLLAEGRDRRRAGPRT